MVNCKIRSSGAPGGQVMASCVPSWTRRGERGVVVALLAGGTKSKVKVRVCIF